MSSGTLVLSLRDIRTVQNRLEFHTKAPMLDLDLFTITIVGQSRSP
jgi:hypothetical protein